MVCLRRRTKKKLIKFELIYEITQIITKLRRIEENATIKLFIYKFYDNNLNLKWNSEAKKD